MSEDRVSDQGTGSYNTAHSTVSTYDWLKQCTSEHEQGGRPFLFLQE